MNWADHHCLICQSTSVEVAEPLGDFVEIVCDDCGRYRVSGSFKRDLQDLPLDRRRELLNIAETQANCGTPMITSYTS